MSQVDDSKVVRGKALKIMDLTPNFSLWRALAGVLTGVFVGHLLSFIVKERVKSLRPEMRASLETGAVLDGALSRHLRTDWGASL
ncbi:MAG: hypothetical protein WCC78_09555 [Terriglobales bacterium]